MKKLFIVGCGRSGTTMLQQALNRHPQIAIPPETAFFSHFYGLLRFTRWSQRSHLRRINKDLEIDMPMPDRRVRQPEEARAVYEEMARLYLRRLGKEDIGYFGEKTPYHLIHLRRIMKVYPDAKILLAYRDGRDVAISLSKVPWGPGSINAGFAMWLRSCRRHEWAARQKNLDLLCVKYEDLAAYPERELRKVADFLDLNYEPEMAEGEGNHEGIAAWQYGWKAQAIKKISTSRIGVWRNELTPEQIRILERWGERELTSLGYELVSQNPGRYPLGAVLGAYGRFVTWWMSRAWYLAGRMIAKRPIPQLTKV